MNGEKKEIIVDMSALDPRLQVLNQYLTKSGKSRRWLGQQIQRGGNVVQKWFERNYWPIREEERIERILGIPPGTFAKMCKTDSDIFLPAPPVSPPSLSQIDISVEEYRRLLDLAPTDPASAERLERVRAHLKSHISLLLELALNDRKVKRSTRKKPAPD